MPKIESVAIVRSTVLMRQRKFRMPQIILAIFFEFKTFALR